MNIKGISALEMSLLFIFFLLVSGNYLENLFPCKIQDFFNNNIYIKHFIGFLTLIFFVVLVESTSKEKNPNFKQIIATSFKLYVLFILLTNNQKRFFVAAIIILGTLYIIQIYKKFSDNKNNKYLKYLNNLEKSLYTVLIIILVIGFIIYYGSKKIEYGKEFKHITFLFGKPECRGVSQHTSYYKSFVAAFKPAPNTTPFKSKMKRPVLSSKAARRMANMNSS